MADRRVSRWLLAGIAAALVAASALYADFVTDDAYIVASFARHYVGAGQLAFNLGEPINAISSPAWEVLAIALQALASALHWPDAVILGLRAASTLCMAAGLLVFCKLALRVCRSSLAAGAASGLLLIDPWVWRWTTSGMEAGLALLCTSASLYLLAAPEPRKRARALALLLAVGLVTRPELALLLGLTALAVWAAEPRLPLEPRRWALFAAALVPLLAWAVFASHELESAWPHTAAAKRGQLGHFAVLVWAGQVIAVGEGLGLAAGALAWLAAVRARGAAPLLVPPQGRVAAVAASWAVGLPLFYAVLGYVPISRYLVAAAPAWLLLAALGFDAWLARAQPAPGLARRALAGVLAVALVASLAATFLRVRPGSTDRTVRAYRAICTWLNANAAPDARVAVPEIGALGYHCDRYLIDLGGLVLPPRDFAALRAGGFTGLLDATRPEYLISLDPADGPPPAMLTNLGERASFERVVSESSQLQTAGKQSSEIRVALYKLSWR